MENLIFIYAVMNFLSLIPTAYAADKRVVSLGFSCLIALIFSPLIGFLYILCHPTKAEKEYQDKMLRKMNDLPDNIKRKLNSEE